MGHVIMHGRPDVTLVGLAAHDVLLGSFIRQTLCNSYYRNNSTGFNNSRCFQKLVV